MADERTRLKKQPTKAGSERRFGPERSTKDFVAIAMREDGKESAALVVAVAKEL